VKLQPSEVDPWNGLGHCYWKKRDLPSARTCFMRALEKGKNKESLRQLSMLLRQLPGTPEETAGYLEESLSRAKQAVAMGLSDPLSWYMLGNAHVASFFRGPNRLEDLNRAMQAYSRAEAFGGGKNPDLYFNRAQVLHFREDFAAAAKDYRTARELDPQLPASVELGAMERGVERLSKLVGKK
ncbi:unnamed protein product, partial [Discosporangium mesarthrocarpum]